ncbi:undecaprenyldiphospho-muramoylpentapeptide beta-N-acetylglucosaminyltransferase [uncultured Selenomonas sp.]|uniref:undecaprenyldiphospho-muramoylpentapeptide beta-N-acetylglucosaminyltransferase n=1 Tax=uncultured Selenomonas sp. TaxID=159275 RepID=UPI0025F30722|nr:undecaprenyldiphospho-muramoylpentapeptide beta-N-acetylglucosaminyltransferase [uncultured Selenomonas sp.]
MNIIVSGGGTGGHIYPAITLIRTLRKKVPDARFLYVGTKRGLESDIVPKEGLPFETIDLQGFERHFTVDNFRRAAKAMLGVAKARHVVKHFHPDAAIGTGGYVCGPILLAASLAGVPTLIQEQNVVPGITNKILSHFVTRIAAGTEDAVQHFPKEKTVFTGNPIRREVLTAQKEDGLREYGFSADKPVVLVSGGSRGARSLNCAMVGVLKEAQKHPEVQFLHATGKGEYDAQMQRLADAGVDLASAPHIQVKPYLYNMPQAMAMADLAIFRAGATGLAELTARGIPAILVPYPYAAENHQEHNARACETAGAARMILDRELTSERLGSVLMELFSEPGKLQAMAAASKAMGRPEAADTIADMVIDMQKK